MLSFVSGVAPVLVKIAPVGTTSRLEAIASVSESQRPDAPESAFVSERTYFRVAVGT
jgi:hypothetical protein